MKYIKITSLLLVVINTMYAKPISITGKALNYPNGKLYIAAYEGQDITVIDSIPVIKGNFMIKNRNFPKGLYKIGPNQNESVDIILGDENIKLSFDKNKFFETVKIENSPENEGLSKYNNANIEFSNKLKLVENKAQSVYTLRNSDPNKFNVEIGKLQKEVDSLTTILFNAYSKVSQNKSAFIYKYTQALMLSDTTPKIKVFKTAELLDADLYRSNLLALKTQMYFQRYTKPEVADYQIAADELIQNLTQKSKGKIQVYKCMLSIFSNANLDYYATILRNFKEEYKDDADVQKYIKSLPKKDLMEGDDAPELAYPDPDGKTISLSSLKGKVVLIDFWASWCGPCRMENPNVVRVYNAYKDKGFTVLGVSLDQSKDKWVGAIKSDGLTWNHVSDLKGWSSDAAKLYSVRSIPQTYLIDKEGKIIAKNLRGEMLESKLQEIFK